MRSRVEVVADVADDGRPVLVRLRADGALAVRRTGPATVHLVGTAAGPLDGDVVELDLVVRPGARLEVEGVAATIALPGPGDQAATWSVTADVGDGAALRCAPQPLVVCAGARLCTRTAVTLAPSATLDLVEQVVLGRYGEPGGTWSGRLLADVGGAPALRQTQTSAMLTTGPTAPGAAAVRSVVSRLLLGPDVPAATAATTATATTATATTTSGAAVICPLATGGVLLSAFGAGLATALRALDDVWPTTDAAVLSPG